MAQSEPPPDNGRDVVQVAPPSVEPYVRVSKPPEPRWFEAASSTWGSAGATATAVSACEPGCADTSTCGGAATASVTAAAAAAPIIVSRR